MSSHHWTFLALLLGAAAFASSSDVACDAEGDELALLSLHHEVKQHVALEGNPILEPIAQSPKGHIFKDVDESMAFWQAYWDKSLSADQIDSKSMKSENDELKSQVAYEALREAKKPQPVTPVSYSMPGQLAPNHRERVAWVGHSTRVGLSRVHSYDIAIFLEYTNPLWKGKVGERGNWTLDDILEKGANNITITKVMTSQMTGIVPEFALRNHMKRQMKSHVLAQAVPLTEQSSFVDLLFGEGSHQYKSVQHISMDSQGMNISNKREKTTFLPAQTIGGRLDSKNMTMNKALLSMLLGPDSEVPELRQAFFDRLMPIQPLKGHKVSGAWGQHLNDIQNKVDLKHANAALKRAKETGKLTGDFSIEAAQEQIKNITARTNGLHAVKDLILD